ncbi:sigma factor-like helix-turn-helix DNA-binding protein [Chloroflexota bacterium]
MADATLYLINRFRNLPKPVLPSLTTRERNIMIRARYAAGESQADLARDFGISYQRVHQIVTGKRK